MKTDLFWALFIVIGFVTIASLILGSSICEAMQTCR